jgi:hypothetical protein
VWTVAGRGVDRSSGLAVASHDAAGSSVALTRGPVPLIGAEPAGELTEGGVWHAAAITPPSIAI